MGDFRRDGGSGLTGEEMRSEDNRVESLSARPRVVLQCFVLTCRSGTRLGVTGGRVRPGPPVTFRLSPLSLRQGYAETTVGFSGTRGPGTGSGT